MSNESLYINVSLILVSLDMGSSRWVRKLTLLQASVY